jgi:hypothetical protein
MTATLTREELYALVWSEPIQKLAPRYGLSDPRRARRPVGGDMLPEQTVPTARLLGLSQKGASRSQRARRDQLAADGSEAKPSTQPRREPVAAGARQDVGRVGQCSP